VAVNCCVLPAAIEGFAGVTAIDTSKGAVTVSVVEPLILLGGGAGDGGGGGLTIGVPGVTRVARPPKGWEGGDGGVVVTNVAMTIVLPAETLLARPAALIVATLGADELQATAAVRFSVLPLPYVPVAVNCCVLPAASDGFTGVTVNEMSPVALPAPLRATTLGLPEAR
jgi:hypothetical protein